MVQQEKKKKGFTFRSLFKKGKKDVENEAVEKVVEVNNVLAEATLKAAPIVETPKAPAAVEEMPSVISVKRSTPETKSWISRTNYFQKMSNWAFDVVDIDGSGCVDEKELYSGLLLIHLKLGSYAGPAACRPVERDRVHEVFLKRDHDNSGSLDREEFSEVMGVLCGNIFTRVFAQWSLTLIIVPMVAKLALDGIGWVLGFIWEKINDLDDIDKIEYVFEARFGQVSAWFCDMVPSGFLKTASIVGTKVQGVIDIVPDSVWESFPVTLVSCVLGCLVVPYAIFKIDDYFQAMADKKKKKTTHAT